MEHFSKTIFSESAPTPCFLIHLYGLHCRQGPTLVIPYNQVQAADPWLTTGTASARQFSEADLVG